MSMIRSAVTSVSDTNGPTGMIPALLISTSSGPSRRSTSVRNASKLGAIGHVERKPERAGAELLRGPLSQRRVDVADRDARALRDQRLRGGAADSACPAGDRDDPAGDWARRLSGHVLVLLVSFSVAGT